jgi:DnaJ-class molecular chaperone
MDPYKELGLKKGATKEDAKKAYRSLARKYHPDKCKSNDSLEKKHNEDRFKKISIAYTMIVENRAYSAVNDDFNFGGKFEEIYRNFNFDKIGKILKETALFGINKLATKNETEDLNVNLHIDLIDIYNNIKKDFNLPLKRKCKSCLSSGSRLIERDLVPCEKCDGTGITLLDEKFTIDPCEKKTVFFRQSHEEFGSKTGNVNIFVYAKPNNSKKLNYRIIDDFNLLLNIPIVEVNTKVFQFTHLDGNKYTINDPYTNTIYSFEERGLYSKGKAKRGDLFIEFIDKPKKIVKINY